jgi:hypothetical protein
MKSSASPQLIAFLNQPNLKFYGADIYEFVLQNTTSVQYAITGISQAPSGVVSYSGSAPVAVGSKVYFNYVAGMTQINMLTGTVLTTGSGTFTVDIATNVFNAYVSGGTFAVLPVFRCSTFDRPILYNGDYYPVARAAVNQLYAVTGISQATLAVVDITKNPFSVGDSMIFESVGGMTEINGMQGYVVARDPATCTITIDTTSFGAYASGGTALMLSVPAMTRSKLSQAVGLKASKADITLQATPDALIAGQPMLTAIAQGALDNAQVTIRRCFMTYGDVHYNDGQLNGPAICNLTGSPFGTGDGTIIWFAGNVGAITKVEALKAEMEVWDLIYLLNRPTPKNTLGPGCWHQLFDEGCGISPGGGFGGVNWTQTGTITSATTPGAQSFSTSVAVGAPPTTPSAPVFYPATGNNGGIKTLPGSFYYAKVTIVSAIGGETLASPESVSVFLDPGYVPQISPPTTPGVPAVGWNVYVGTESGAENLQNGVPIPFSGAGSGPWVCPNVGISYNVETPPVFPGAGYWSQGVITFTSGVLNGISAVVDTSDDATGFMTLRVPLIIAPTVGTSFSVQCNCVKTYYSCSSKFGNTIHLSSVPFCPSPEQAF